MPLAPGSGRVASRRYPEQAPQQASPPRPPPPPEEATFRRGGVRCKEWGVGRFLMSAEPLYGRALGRRVPLISRKAQDRLWASARTGSEPQNF